MYKDRIIKRLEYCAENKCDICQEENGSGFPWIDGRCYGFTERLYDAIALLKSQESVVHGRPVWINPLDPGAKICMWKCSSLCSVCGDYVAADWKYCPNCGAKMDKEK